MSATNETLVSNSTIVDSNAVYPVVYGVLLCIVLALSLPANVVIWLTVLRIRSLRGTITNILMLNLSAADFLVLTVNMPFNIASLLAGYVPTQASCTVLGFCNMLSFVGSVMALTLISINRYCAVCRSVSVGDWFSKARTALYIGVCWVITLLLSTPPLLGWCSYAYTPQHGICFAAWPLSASYTVFMVLVCFGGPASVMLLSNTLIFRHVRQSKSKVAMAGPQTKRSQKQETKLAQVMVTIILCFVVSWLPYCIDMFLMVAGRPLPGAVSMATLTLGYSNSAMNPFLYGALNHNIRKRLLSYVSCLRRTAHTNHVITSGMSIIVKGRPPTPPPSPPVDTGHMMVKCLPPVES